jgi:hypothetical protein
VEGMIAYCNDEIILLCKSPAQIEDHFATFEYYHLGGKNAEYDLVIAISCFF